jgi:hypothetical protein
VSPGLAHHYKWLLVDTVTSIAIGILPATVVTFIAIELKGSLIVE